MQDNIQFNNERHAETIVAELMRNKLNCICRRQVPINGKIPDIIGYYAKSDTTFSVEIKLKNWKRGIYQAFMNKNLFDYSFLCLPLYRYKAVRYKIKKELDLTGIGIIVVNPIKYELSINRIPQRNEINDSRRIIIKNLILNMEGN